jgi:hypothetical protein
MTAASPCRVTLLLFCLVLVLESSSLAANPKPLPTKADIPFGPHPHQLLDICLPPKGDGPFPVVIWFGGLWAPSKGVPLIDRFFPERSGRCS